MGHTPLAGLLRRSFRAACGTNGRRAFLKTAAGLVTLPLLAACTTRETKISIIGGGLAGLRAAWQLKKSGIPFNLFEATGRTGGRVLSIADAVHDGSAVDFGAEYVDATHSELLEVAKELNVTITDLRNDTLRSRSYFFQGRFLEESDIVQALVPFAESIQKDIESLPEELHYRNASAMERLDKQSVTGYLTSLGISGWLYDFLEMATASEYTMEATEQSAINFLVMLSTPIQYDEHYHLFGSYHEVMKISGGSSMLADALAAQVNVHIKTGHVLKKIDRTETGYQLHLETETGLLIADADMILLTLPFRALSRVEKNFRFSDRKEKAIAESGFGNGSKTALGFTGRVWREQGHQGYTFTDVNRTVMWDSSQGYETEGGSLTFTGGGRLAEEFGRATYPEIEQRWLGGADKIYPGLAQVYNRRIAKFCWADHPFAGGSYTSYKPGQWSEFSGIEAEPEGNILFAGEHCSIEHQGYMNGALESGRLAAAEIIRRLQA